MDDQRTWLRRMRPDMLTGAVPGQSTGQHNHQFGPTGRDLAMTWDKHTKPPPDFCPGQYCFQWVAPGGAADMSGRSYRSLEEAITGRDDWVEFPQGGCGCAFGLCTRLDPVLGDHDWYEPCEPALERDGLPWFYFIPSVDQLSPEFHERYLRESRELWGEAGPG